MPRVYFQVCIDQLVNAFSWDFSVIIYLFRHSRLEVLITISILLTTLIIKTKMKLKEISTDIFTF